MFKKESGDWKRYRRLPNVVEVDCHYSNRRREYVPCRQSMENVLTETLEANWYLFAVSFALPHGIETVASFRIVIKSDNHSVGVYAIWKRS
jgi:hypothetical protein